MNKNLKNLCGVEYWNKELESLNEETIRYDCYKEGYTKESYSILVNKEIFLGLDKVCRGDKLLIYSFLTSAMLINLSNYMLSDNIIIGIPYYSKNAVAKIVSNKVLPLISCIDNKKSYKKFAIEIKNKISQIYKNQDSFKLTLLKEKKIHMDVMELTSLNISMKDIHDDKYINYITSSSKNNISFIFEVLSDNSLKLNISYNSNKFFKETIISLSKSFTKIISTVLQDYDKKIEDIDVLDEEDKNMLLHFNNSKVNYNFDKTITELIEEQAEKFPENIAVEFKDKKLTYRKLNEKANALAQVLRKKGVKADSVVGLMVDRSIEMIVGMLAILKAGGAYLPIDPEFPTERIEYMLSDSKSSILLTTGELSKEVSIQCELIDLYEKDIFEMNAANLEKINGVENLAYIIYTSGTTGKPKGVMITHRNLNNFVTNFNGQFDSPIGVEDKVLSLTNYVFDVSVSEIFTALVNGATLVINDKHKTFDPLEISKLIIKHEITFTYIAPLLLSNVYERLNREKAKVKLNKLLVGVAPIKGKVMNDYHKLNENFEVVNGYGPTEATICSTFYKVNKNEPEEENIPIGKPIGNSKIYILNKNKLQSIGAVGELCVSGDGVAKGYLNNEKLTDEKFVDNPFEPGIKMYRTGDMAKWRLDGNIEFIGRADEQVKIRGFRIELGEIKSKLLENREIEKAAVIVNNEQQEKFICAYIVSEKEIEDLNLRDYLLKSLPEYMIPAYFIKLEEMPLTPNGKLDKRKLPKPNLDKVSKQYEAPRNELEKTIEKIWCEVLGRKKIGINDSFFELGGHSLKAMVLISKIAQAVQKDIPLDKLFEEPTIKGISKYIENAEDSVYSGIGKVEEKEYYEVSSHQARMYVTTSYNKESTVNNMPNVFEIKGNIDFKRIEDTLGKIVARHDALRSSFHVIDGDIVQKIAKNYDFKLEVEESLKSIDEVVEDFVKVFDLNKPPLFRFKIVKTKEGYFLLIDMHHIISDGVSMNILMNEFVSIYNGEELPELKIQYKDYAVWQQKSLMSDEIKKQEKYWLDTVFSGDIPVLELPYDYKRPAVQSFRGADVYLTINKELSKKLKDLAKKNNTTMHMVLLSAFYILLAKCSGQEDIVVGTPIAGRPYAEIQEIVGVFTNTIVLRNKPEKNKKYIDFLKEVRENSLNAYKNQSYPLNALIERFNMVKDASRNPLFNVMFNMIDTISNFDINLEDISLIHYNIKKDVSKVDLTLNVVENKDVFEISAEYATDLFNEKTIEKYGEYYLTILEAITENNDIRIQDIELLTEEDKRKLLKEFNDTKTTYPKDKTIQELFELETEKDPNKTAIVYKDKKVTYKELNEKSNNVAKALVEKGVQADDVVALYMDKSIEIIVGILGILKAGAGYLVVGKQIPESRKSYMLKDSNVSIIIADSNLDIKLDSNINVLNINDLLVERNNSDDVNVVTTPNSLAYIIYTSGSTGMPKGVAVEHRNIVRLVKNTNYIDFNREYKMLQAGVIEFDASTFEIWGALLNGLELHLCNKETLMDIDKIQSYVQNNKIDIMLLTSALFTHLAEENMELFDGVKYLLVGGDVLSIKHINKLRLSNKDITIINAYGPTENTTISTYYKVEEECDGSIPIGRAIANSTAYIFDKDMKLTSPGIVGELYVGGDGVARGYINNDKLTEERFIQNPYNSEERIYKTGDMARWNLDGNIEFFGRADNQVKIRGFRIELDEIENALLKNKYIKEAVVVIKEKNENKYIYAYIVCDEEIDTFKLREKLKEKLPLYMIPSSIIQLDEIPLTSNGKIDKKALNQLKVEEVALTYEAPRNDLEKEIAEIWKEVLGVESVDINSNFFEIGGHSLSSIRLISKFNEKFNSNLLMKDFYYKLTIKQLADYIIENREVRINRSNDDVVLINSTNKESVEEAKNLFVIHDGSGDINGYINLACNLRDNIKCFGIKFDKEYIFKHDDYCIEDIAKVYIEKIHNIQSEGPYNVAGWSLGGVVAFEIARQMEKMGEVINNVILIDSHLYSNEENKDAFLEKDTSLDYIKKYVIDAIDDKDLKGKINKESSIDNKWNIVKENITDEQVEKIKLMLPKNLLNLIPDIKELDIDESVNRIYMIRKISNAMILYTPKNKIKKQPILFKATEKAYFSSDVWNEYCEEEVIIKEISANHNTILKGENAISVAESINNLIM